MRLCLVFGEPNPDRFLERIDSKQLSEWYAFSIVEPFGPAAEDLRWASGMSFFSRKLAGKNECPTPLRGWALQALPPAEEQTEDEMMAVMKQWTGMQKNDGNNSGIERRG